MQPSQSRVDAVDQCVAALAGGEWPARARAAVVALAKANVADDAGHGHLLLVAMRGVFDRAGSPVASKTICHALNADEELPFGDYAKGAGIGPRKLAAMLRPYAIKPRNVRVGAETPKGYTRDQFAEAWERYDAAHTQHTRTHPPHPPHRHIPDSNEDSVWPLWRTETPHTPHVADSDEKTPHENADKHGDVADVADVADTQGVRDAHASNNGHVDDEERIAEARVWIAERDSTPRESPSRESMSGLTTDEYVRRFRQRHAERAWGLGANHGDD